ncbi:MAG: glycosyltransferase family 2 protein [Bacteroidetes bacterium]|nr:glycosyltransferase family 2 protein [Bacteroidota bacterium]
MDISIVIPLLNESESLPELHDWLLQVCTENNLSYEIIFIDDGSSDGSWDTITSLSKKDAHTKAIRFRRNYGKSAALNVGFAAAQGNVIITMDADLQDSPDEIPGLYNKIIHEHFDLISGWKKKRYDSTLTKNIPSKLFNWATQSMSGIKLHDFNCGLKAYRREVVKSIEVYGEMHRYIPVIAKWAGFNRIGEKVVEHRARKYGTTKFGLERFVNGFLDLLTIFFMGRFGKRPMHFFGVLGTLSFLAGFVTTLWLVYEKVFMYTEYSRNVVEKPSFYIALTMLIVGVVLFLAGFLGELISRTGGDRNAYNISEKLGLN